MQFKEAVTYPRPPHYNMAKSESKDCQTPETELFTTHSVILMMRRMVMMVVIMVAVMVIGGV